MTLYEHDIQTIVEIVILVFFVGLMFIPFLLFFVYVFLLGKCPFQTEPSHSSV